MDRLIVLSKGLGLPKLEPRRCAILHVSVLNDLRKINPLRLFFGSYLIYLK